MCIAWLANPPTPPAPSLPVRLVQRLGGWEEATDRLEPEDAFRAHRRAIMQRMRDRRRADPERNAAHLAQRRELEAIYRAKRKADPVKYEAFRKRVSLANKQQRAK